MANAECLKLAVRGKNKKEVVESLWKRFTQSADEVLLSGQRDVDDFFEHERNYLVEYNTHIKDAASKAEKVVKLRKSLAFLLHHKANSCPYYKRRLFFPNEYFTYMSLNFLCLTYIFA
ncbi:hypothetical protein Y032_0413g996 [Ancylostoma ceylanicum]|nr:hypothetical protein Y032_0413g996 [Ancylostoma ceylanicum]